MCAGTIAPLEVIWVSYPSEKTQLPMRFGTPLCHDLYSDNETCANPPADLGGALRYSPASTAVSWSYDGLLTKGQPGLCPPSGAVTNMTEIVFHFLAGSPSHDLYAVKSHIADMAIRKVRYHALAVFTASAFM